MQVLLRLLLESLVRLFFPVVALEGRERLPAAGPVLFVLNHPNGLLDPIVLRLALGRPVRFLAKSTLFGNPAGRAAMAAFGAIPVYRRQDVGKGGGDTAGNDRTFALCREALARGEALALFPEGTTHSEPQLKPLKTGAARIALSAAAEHASARGLHVVPVGLFYEDKTIFRSRTLAVVGEPIAVEGLLAGYAEDERGAVEALTERVRAGLARVVLQAETRELLEGVARLAVWTSAAPDARDDLAARHARARELLRAYEALSARDPARVEAIVADAREYARALTELGVSDPWALEVGRVRVGAALALLFAIAWRLPVAVVGAALGYLPYRAAGVLAQRLFAQDDVLGTVKLLAGALLLPLTWIAEAVLAGVLLGPWWGALVLVAGPAAGYVALRYSERTGVLGEGLRHLWLRGADPETSQALGARRRALADAVARALRDADAGASGNANASADASADARAV